MIAVAVVLSGLAPETFGVEATPELGAEILDVLAERARDEHLAEMRQRLKNRTG